MQNHLKDQTSPYLLQHVDNPVDWYPWCEEAFERAKAEDKPIFLSIGYSTCHWCHVMAHESFEDEEIAEILNKYFISIKVDKEERPDIDSIYMAVCQAFTGSGGWPTTIFMTSEQNPFFAGTYFPRTSRYGQVGFADLILSIHRKWKDERNELLKSADEIMYHMKRGVKSGGEADERILWKAVEMYQKAYDEECGGFGDAPKFPSPHNLLFLMDYYEKRGQKEVLRMTEKTLIQMYRGGLFDHIGGGFSRYSTDRYFFAPHFEKMLYDNALLIMAYCRAYEITKSQIYRTVAERTAEYILREMTSKDGGFYSAQDADSDGIEGKYYLFEPGEIIKILGEKEGKTFNQYYDITEAGNFEGKNIPNLLRSYSMDERFWEERAKVYQYRKNRYALHLDDKILTSWNGLMIAAMCHLYRVSKKENYLEAAVKAETFIQDKLCEKNTLYVSYRIGRRGEKGFADEYANVIFALISLYEMTFQAEYLEKAQRFLNKMLTEFYDSEEGGFFLYGKENEQLIFQPKETYDGAIPSSNSVMAYNLVRLYELTGKEKIGELTEKQMRFMAGEARYYPAGYSMFLMALLRYLQHILV